MHGANRNCCTQRLVNCNLAYTNLLLNSDFILWFQKAGGMTYELGLND